MIAVEPFQPAHLAAMAVQAAQAEVPADRIEHGRFLSASGQCFTILHAGNPIFCGGAMEMHPHYAQLWSAFDCAAGPMMLAITRRTRWFLEKLPYRRIDTFVRVGHVQGVRWAEALGFELEGTLGELFEDGSAAHVFRWRDAPPAWLMMMREREAG